MIKSPFVYPLSNFFQRTTLKLFADWKVTGRGNVPPMGPLIVIANHQSNFDPSLLSASIPRRLWFLAKKSMFRGFFLNWFLRSYGAFPLNRVGTDAKAFRWVLAQLDRGAAVVVFPEGTRSKGEMQKAKTGIVRLAIQSQAPLLPVGITGTEEMGTWLRIFKPTGRIEVNIGTPFSVPSVEGKLSPEVLESITDIVMYRIADLLPKRYQGVYTLGNDQRQFQRRRAGVSI